MGGAWVGQGMSVVGGCGVGEWIEYGWGCVGVIWWVRLGVELVW